MDISSSQYNSASESGWTHYLDQSSLSGNNFQRRSGMIDYEATMEKEEEEEDLSMVSDASSGPPHYHEEDDQPYCLNWYPSTSQCTKETKKKNKVRECGKNQHPSPLDDTASSPVLNFPKKKNSFSGNGAVDNALGFSQCFSATKIKRKPKLQKQFSFFERSLGGKQDSEEQGSADLEVLKYVYYSCTVNGTIGCFQLGKLFVSSLVRENCENADSV
ncbi:uncharacterized protein LOC113866257 [Abrus precatorius]|uniref:Uncharacterized protein LOC113866257 n=1 Tax=Abrus precatorius TaxID=3816 RepID=A0A8B8LLW1_ABRPR|nr:uncharacterized protein LOC113866257 [Abrus precatorius]